VGPFFAIFTMRADGSGVRQVSDRFGQFVAWSPDGRKLLVSPGLTVMNRDGSDVRPIAAGVEGIFADWVG
jgi:Tol biopolymer transport system component